MNQEARSCHQSRPSKTLLLVLTGLGNPKNIQRTVLTEQVSPVNSLHWARTPHTPRGFSFWL